MESDINIDTEEGEAPLVEVEVFIYQFVKQPQYFFLLKILLCLLATLERTVVVGGHSRVSSVYMLLL